jgi:large conductance mechanosensitive channel
MIVRSINKFRDRIEAKKKAEEAAKAAATPPPAPVVPEDIVLLKEIRDLLKK